MFGQSVACKCLRRVSQASEVVMVVAVTRATRIVPVAALKTQAMAMDAAMLVAVARAEGGAVHKLRTCTRRVQAQMTLLDALAGGAAPLLLPAHKDEVAVVVRRLRVVRQAAGAVRDLDVQCDAIRTDAPAKSAVHAGTPGDRIRTEAKQLRKHLKGQRAHEAATLMRVLRDEDERLAASLRALEKVLKPAGRRTVAHAVLVERIEHWFALRTRSVMRPREKAGETTKDALMRTVQRLSEDALHTIRKAAKLCRYMAESAPEGSAVRARSQRFEAMQEAGGAWHDWLLLERLSSRFHGKEAALTVRYRKHRDAARAEYQLKLVELLPAVLP
jgi:CHAD domain-containing protein